MEQEIHRRISGGQSRYDLDRAVNKYDKFESEWSYHWNHSFDWQTLFTVYKNKFPTADGYKDESELSAAMKDLWDETNRWVDQKLAPRARELDRVGPGSLTPEGFIPSDPLKQTYDEIDRMGLRALCASQEHGGMGLPLAMGLLVFQSISRGCLATSAQIAFTTSFADMLEKFASNEIQSRAIPQVVSGRRSGSMCITEPGAGSDVGAINTTAMRKEDGTYVLNGTKCFITNGAGGLGLVLARVQGTTAGLKGLSLFFVEQEQNAYQVTKIEDKMGMIGSATCEIVYENTPAKLVGAEGEGFSMMLHLMNEARVSVGLQGLGAIEAALEKVYRYSLERKQFGVALMELPLFRKNWEEMVIECDAIRSFMVDTVYHFDVSQKLEQREKAGDYLTELERNLLHQSKKIIRERTPLAKFYGSEAAARLTQKAIQCFGGYGYVKEYDIERLHRDAIGGLLYEGTSQIQSLMAMKDFGKQIQKYKLKGLNLFFKALLSKRKWRAIETKFYRVMLPLFWFRDINSLMEKAEVYCEAKTYLEVLRVLFLQASNDPSRRLLFERYSEIALPRLEGLYARCRNSKVPK